MKCPFRIESVSGVPQDSVRAARLNRFLDWRWEHDPDFRAEMTKAGDDDLRAYLDRLIWGDSPPQ